MESVEVKQQSKIFEYSFLKVHFPINDILYLEFKF